MKKKLFLLLVPIVLTSTVYGLTEKLLQKGIGNDSLRLNIKKIPPVEKPILWLNAENRESIILDKELRVVEWKGDGFSVQQTNASLRPLYKPVALNSKSGIVFTGKEWLVSSSKSKLTNQFTVFVVFETEEEHPLRLMGLLGNGGISQKSPGMALGFNDSDIVLRNNAVAFGVHDNSQPLVAAFNTGDSRKFGLARELSPQFPTLISAIVKPGSVPVINVQGKQLAVNLPAIPNSDGIDLIKNMTIGAADATGKNPFKGVISEILIYDRALTKEEYIQVDNWLKSRYELKMPNPIIFDHRALQAPLTIRPQTVDKDGVMLRIAGDILYESKDGEKWVKRTAVTRDPAFPKITLSGGLLAVTSKGVLTVIVGDRRPEGFVKITREGNTYNHKDAKSHIYAFRSLDGGKTWQDGKLIQTAYCGAMRDIKVTRQGHVLASLQAWDPETERHVTVIHASVDEGKTWTNTRVDNGIGKGMHDGFYESTIVELNNGKIWMLGRTGLGVFWQSFSKDGGITWAKPTITNIESGSYPGFLIRLKSGKLLLAWNRYYPDGYSKRDDLINIAGKSWYWGEQAVSRFNRELSIMFSSDDGESWSKPVVIAEGRQDFAALSYPFMIERKPGEIYLWGGSVAIKFNETDFFKDLKKK